MASFVNMVGGKRFPGLMVTYLGRINNDVELKKAAQGKRTKIPAELVVYGALRGYPRIQAKLAKAIGVKTR